MLIIFFISTLLISTKLADVLTTIHIMETEVDVGEANPLVRFLMKHLGAKRAMWVVFSISLILFLGMAIYTKQNEDFIGFFIIFGLVISTMQVAVAHTNWTGKENLITRVSYTYFSWHENLFSLLFSGDSTDDDE